MAGGSFRVGPRGVEPARAQGPAGRTGPRLPGLSIPGDSISTLSGCTPDGWAVYYADGRAAAAGTVEEVLATGAIERAFGVSIRPHAAAEGIAYTLFPA